MVIIESELKVMAQNTLNLRLVIVYRRQAKDLSEITWSEKKP